VRLPSGDVVDPAFLSASNLIRMPEPDCAAVLEWAAGERLRLAERADAAERSAREIAETMRPKLEEAARGRADWVSRNWSPGS
jgi:hypothetical protein